MSRDNAPRSGRARPARYEVLPEKSAVAEPRPDYGVSPRVLSATEAARNFSHLINQVCYSGQTFIVERAGKVMCQIVPAAAKRCTGRELLSVWRSLPRQSEDFLSELEEIVRNQPPIETSPWEK